MSIPSITVGDEREEVVVKRMDDGNVVLIVDGQWMKGVSVGLLRSIHQAVGAYLALVK
jgi:polynucleotide 5'-kinase involved in rRNA processing